MTHGHRFTLVAGTAIATASLLCGAAGAAVTGSRAGSAAGAAWAWLQSSPPGYGIYARLGFRTVETWDCWIAAG